MPFIASFLASAIPMLVYLLLLWKIDKYEREPLSKVFKHFLWGAIGAVILAILFSSLFNFTTSLFISNNISLSFIAAVIVAPFTEELVKASLLFVTYKRNYFDNVTDGLLYGAAIGLGFGMTENLMYFLSNDSDVTQWITVVLIRSLFSAVMHGIATATVGAFLAKMKFSLNHLKFVYPIIGICLAMIFHASWNFSLSASFTVVLGFLFMLFLTTTFFVVLKVSLKHELEIINQELNDEVLFADFKNSTLKKYSEFIKDKIAKKQFVNFATKLAFRKFQIRNASDKLKQSYNQDINDLRIRIENILKTNGKV